MNLPIYIVCLIISLQVGIIACVLIFIFKSSVLIGSISNLVDIINIKTSIMIPDEEDKTGGKPEQTTGNPPGTEEK